MRQKICYRIFSALALVVLFLFCTSNIESVMAEDSNNVNQGELAENSSEQVTIPATNITIMPVNRTFQLESDKEYTDVLSVTNNGDAAVRVEIYAAPYSYVYSDLDGTYQPGYNNENNFTQIVRWISIQDDSGKYVTRPNFVIDAHATREIKYKITTPDNIPSGGQYAVLFAHTMASGLVRNGISTEASLGMVIYGRTIGGETTIDAEITGLKIEQESTPSGKLLRASAKIKNIGNVDFNATGTLKVKDLWSDASYETDLEKGGRISVIPESEPTLEDTWDDMPDFGFFQATWTVTAAGETVEITKTFITIPPVLICIIIIVLTLLIVWIILMVRKRKVRRSRLTV